MKFTALNIVAIIAAVAALPLSVIMLKISAQMWHDSIWASSWYFFLANVVGFLNPIGTTIALRDNKPNVVYATIGAPAIIVLHIALAWYFHSSLTWWQWLAIGIIALGAILMQTGPVDTSAAPLQLGEVLDKSKKKDDDGLSCNTAT